MPEPDSKGAKALELVATMEQCAVAVHRALAGKKATAWLRLPDGVDVMIGDLRYNAQSGVSIRLGESQVPEASEPMKSAVEKALDYLDDPKVREWLNRSGYRTCGTGSYGDVVVGLRALLGKGNKEDEGT